MAEYDIESMQAEDIVIDYFNALVRIYPGPSGLDRHVIQVFDNYDNLRIRAEEEGGDYMAIIPELINAAMNTHLEAEEFTYATLMVPHTRFLAVQVIVKPNRPLPFFAAPDSEDAYESDFMTEVRREILKQFGIDADDPDMQVELSAFQQAADDAVAALEQAARNPDAADQNATEMTDADQDDIEMDTQDEEAAENDERSNAEQFYIRIMSIYQRMMFYDQIERAEMLLYRFLPSERQREIIRQNHDRQESAFNNVGDLIDEWVDICAVN